MQSPWQEITARMEARGWTRTDLAKAMGGPAKVNGYAIDLLASLPPLTHVGLGPAVARQLAHALGDSPQWWLELDRKWRAEHAPARANG